MKPKGIWIFTLFAASLLGASVLPAQTTTAGAAGFAGMQGTRPGAEPQSGTGELFGAVPSGKPVPGVLPLSITDAIKMGLKNNLGMLLQEQNLRSARGARLAALSELLPNITTATNESSKQVNLAAFGFSGFPGVKPIVGPFNVFDARAYVTQSVLNFRAINQTRAESQNITAAEHAAKNTRELVVLVCGNLYLQAVAGQSRIEAARAQYATSQALYKLAVDQKQAGTVPGIDVLRAQVEMQARQQQVTLAEEEGEREKLNLARAIGLPEGQEFNLTDPLPYKPHPPISLEDALQQAYQNREDYQAAQSRVKALEFERRAAAADRLPSVDLNADYGDIGSNPLSSHGTYTVFANLRIPIFQGGRVRGRVMEAEAALEQQRARTEDLRSRIYYEIRTIFLQLNSSDARVKVAQSTIDLAREQLTQARDRFQAGVSNHIEVVQAQEALALSEENLIQSVYEYNTSKANLARALGIAESSYEQFLRGK
jgi:outer membrane protein TolC